MPTLPILCSGCLWAGYRADSAGCEVSLNCTFVRLFLATFCSPGFSVFLLLLLLDGLVYMVALWWVVFACCFSVV
jgi:hypothetical protein